MKYFTTPTGFARNVKKGTDQLSNFLCHIDEELTYHDGGKKTTLLKISGTIPQTEGDPIQLPQITIHATELGSMSWIPEQWGVGPIVFPVESAERDLKAAIQLNSKPVRKNIYTHTGWTMIDGKRVYLSKSGGISEAGLNSNINVELPNELTRFRLPPPSNLADLFGKQQAKDCWTASMQLANLGPKDMLWPMILAAYRSAIGPADFALHVTGKTGTFKSELTSLIQSHFGDEMDARHLPASWASTANANEALLYRAKDAICVIDDFVPQGQSYQVRALQATADRLIRAQGNQAGRARLTDVSSLQQTMYPRGIILSTGEDTPEGHSVRARSLIIELEPGSIPADRLTKAQAARSKLPQAMSDWIHWLASEKLGGASAREFVRGQAMKHRDGNLGVGHARTPAIIGDLIATAELLFQYARDQGYYPAAKCDQLRDGAWKAVVDAGAKQLQYLTEADPVEAILHAIKQLLGTQKAHARTRNGGIPRDAEQCGFTKVEIAGEANTYAAHGPTIAWLDYDKDEFLLDPNHMSQLKKVANIGVTDATLIKRMKEAGILTRTDEARQQVKVRVNAGGQTQRYVLAIGLDHILERNDA